MKASTRRALCTATLAVLGCAEEAWPVCDNRAYRDDETEPGGLKLLGVQESPLGYFPQTPAALTHEHFFQQLREVLSDDCPRVMVQLGLQPAPGLLRNWTSAALWLRYFNHSGIVLAVDPIEDYLAHFQATLAQEPWSSLDRVEVKVQKASVALQAQGKAKDRPVSFDTPDGVKAIAADEVMRSCRDVSGPLDNPLHACSRILRRMSEPEPLEYTAPVLSFDDIWAKRLGSKHIDFLHVDIGAKQMADMFAKGFSRVIQSRSFTVLAFRVDAMWSKDELKKVVELLDKAEYFSMIRMVCRESSQVGSFSYYGPGDLQAGPTTYLPLSSMDLDSILDWDKMPLPQDVLALDLRQPDVFKTVQLGDVHCDTDEDVSSTCEAGDESCKEAEGPPERPQFLQVTRSSSRSLTLEWRPHAEGPTPDSYLLRIDPGAQEDTLEHDTFDQLRGTQMHTINGLRPDTEYTMSLRALNMGGESSKASITHRTQYEEAPALDSRYQIIESMHCGMGAAEEVQPAGPAPGGASFFPGVGDIEGCRLRCDDNRLCVAFQVHGGDACWLYRRKPAESRLASSGSDMGWWCSVRAD